MSASRIVFLNPWDRLIGPNRFLVEILRQEPALARRSLVVLPTRGEAAEEYGRLGCDTAFGSETALVHPRLSVSNLRSLACAHTFGLARAIERLRKERPSLVVSNGESILTGSIASRCLGLPHVQVFHGMTFHDRLSGRPFLMKTYARLYDTLNTEIVVVSHAVRAALEHSGVPASKISVVPNPVNLEREAPSVVERGSGSTLARFSSPLLVTAGRISPMKGQDLLVEALPKVLKEFPRLRCVFAGRVGSDAGIEDTVGFMRDLEKRIGELRISDHIHFAGEVESLTPLLQQADLYIQPSRTESFGRVVAEALACGTPVVAFAVGGVPEVAGPGAVLVEPDNPLVLSEAIVGALRAPDEMAEKARRGREHVKENYEACRVAESFRRLLDNVINERAA